MEFISFDKIARLSRPCVITEKIDGTNASITITDDGQFLIGSRSRWITPEEDNYGFARWAMTNKEELLKLGPGTHYGEWWGSGIQRRYDLNEKRFSLFNTARWSDDTIRPTCCNVVPVLYSGVFDTEQVFLALQDLRINGSKASPGFMKPEGVIIWHEAARIYFKKTIEKDEAPKGIVTA
jgi:RNA ligase